MWARLLRSAVVGALCPYPIPMCKSLNPHYLTFTHAHDFACRELDSTRGDRLTIKRFKTSHTSTGWSAVCRDSTWPRMTTKQVSRMSCSHAAPAGVVLYEYLGEEYPEVLGSILGALKAIVNVIGMTKMTPPIKELLPRLTPVLKNRHEKVSTGVGRNWQ